MIERVRGYGCLWVFDVFRTFCFLDPWFHHHSTSTMERCAYELDTHLYTTAVVHLLYYCINTWVGGWLRGCHCCTTYCCTAVVQGCGCVDRFVPVVCSCGVFTRVSWVIFICDIFSPAIPAPCLHSSAYHKYCYNSLNNEQ